MKEKIEHEMLERVTIDVGRWTATVTIEERAGETYRYVFSADSGDTQNDGIYFATGDEYDEHVRRGGW